MNKPALMTLLAATVLPISSMAQSTVTLYGRLDVSVESLRFGSTSTRAASHLNVVTSDASNWGIRGSEDLGDGLRAFFKLESGIAVDTGIAGASSQFWNRESYVGLGSDTFGSLLLGSQWAPGLWQSINVDPFQRFGPGGQPTLMQGGQGSRGYGLQFNNAVQYITPKFGGVSARLYAVPSEGAGAGKAQAVSVDFKEGPIFAGALYEKIKVAAPSVGLIGGPVDSRTASAAGTYDFGVAKLHAQYMTNRIDGYSNVNAYLAGVTVPFGLSEVRASYAHRSATNANATNIGVGYVYFLSKRTLLTATVAHLKNEGAAAFRSGPAFGEQAALGPAGPGAGQPTTAYQLGVRHYF